MPIWWNNSHRYLLGSVISPAFDQVHNTRDEFFFLRSKPQIQSEGSRTPLIVMPLLHQLVHPAWEAAIACRGYCWVKPSISPLSPWLANQNTFSTWKASQLRGSFKVSYSLISPCCATKVCGVSSNGVLPCNCKDKSSIVAVACLFWWSLGLPIYNS